MTLQTIWRSLWSRAWLVLAFMAFVSGANSVAARIATNEMPPLLLVFLRWAIVCTTLALMFDADQRHEFRELWRGHWRRLAWMGLLGYSGFNALFYIAAYHTSAVNLSIVQSAIPALVLIGMVTVFRARISALQVVGLVLTCLGVLVVGAQGDMRKLAALHFGIGDVFVLIASFFYACYTLGLRVRPVATPIVFFAGVAAAALIWSLPMAAAEALSGRVYWPSGKGWFVTLLIAYGPSFAGQLCWMRGVDLIGPARAGLFANLIPIFGALGGVLVLHESFAPFHLLALTLALGGIALAEWSGIRSARLGPAAPPSPSETSECRS